MAIQTNVVWGRLLEGAEGASLIDYINTAVASGTTDGIRTGSAPNEPIVRTWTTTDAANSFLSFCQAFNPAPVSAVVTS
jgi:hypothetical protein